MWRCNAIQGNILYILSEKIRRMLLRLNSANYFITTPPTPTIPPPHPIIPNPIEVAAKIPSEELVWFRDYWTYTAYKKIKWNHITTYNIFYFSVCQLPLINEELYGQYCYLMFSPNKTARQIIEKSHENRRQIFL